MRERLRNFWYWLIGVRTVYDWRGRCARCGRTGQAHNDWRCWRYRKEKK